MLTLQKEPIVSWYLQTAVPAYRSSDLARLHGEKANIIGLSYGTKGSGPISCLLAWGRSRQTLPNRLPMVTNRRGLKAHLY